MKRQIQFHLMGGLGLCFFIALFSGCSLPYEEMPVTTTSEDARQLFIEGRELYENLREDEARELFYQAIEKDQNFALCHYYLADAAASAVDYHTHLILAAQLSSKVSEGERLLIESMRALAENNPSLAREKLGELVQLYPNDKRAHRLLGYHYRGFDEDKAIAEYEMATRLDKNYAPAYNNLGYAYQRKGEYDKAIDAFKKYSELLPDEANPHDSIAELYKKMGHYEESIEHYKMALELKSTFAFSHRNIGENLIYLGNFEEARYMFEEVQKLDVTPNKKIDALQMIAHSYVYEEKYEEALAASDRALDFAAASNLPEWQATILLDKAMIYMQHNELDLASKCVEESGQVVSDANLSQATKENIMKDAIYSESEIAAQRKDFDNAFALAENLKIKIDASNDPQEIEKYHNLLGFIHAMQGYHTTAIRHFKKAKSKDPYSLYLWGKCEAIQGNQEEANQRFQEIMNLNESNIQYALVRPKVQKELQQKENPN
jgi:tetratricopeptide (TPR) repeat protein